MSAPDDAVEIGFGATVSNADGDALGTVRGFDEHGFSVTTEAGIEALSSEHRRAGAAAEAELLWRCWACGGIGDIEEIPEACPACGAPKADIYYWQED